MYCLYTAHLTLPTSLQAALSRHHGTTMHCIVIFLTHAAGRTASNATCPQRLNSTSRLAPSPADCASFQSTPSLLLFLCGSWHHVQHALGRSRLDIQHPLGRPFRLLC